MKLIKVSFAGNLRDDDRIGYIIVDNLLTFREHGKYTKVKYVNGETEVVAATLQEFESGLKKMMQEV